MNNRFRNTLASLLLIAIPTVVMSVYRPLLSNTYSYIYMNWNLFLGLLPLLFAGLYYKGIGGKYVTTLWFILWIAFLPNAPYMITDFIHLADVGPRSILWYDAIMLFGFAWVGMIAWLRSVSLVYRKNRYVSFVPIITFLTAIGLYLGRYVRFNTWDILTQPLDIIRYVIDIFVSPLEHSPFLLFSNVFWIFLMLAYVGYTHMHHLLPEKNDTE